MICKRQHAASSYHLFLSISRQGRYGKIGYLHYQMLHPQKKRSSPTVLCSSYRKTNLYLITFICMYGGRSPFSHIAGLVFWRWIIPRSQKRQSELLRGKSRNPPACLDLAMKKERMQWRVALLLIVLKMEESSLSSCLNCSLNHEMVSINHIIINQL